MNLERYRKNFRQKVIPKYYSAKIHLLIFSAFEVASISISAKYIEWSWLSPLWIFLSIFWASTFLYFLHRFMLHRIVPGFAWAHKMHHWHHTFYQSENMEYDELNDVYMLLMPPWIQLIYFVLYLPFITWALSHLFPPVFVPHFIFALTVWYGLYELIHWIEHLSDKHMVMTFGWARKMKRHHRGHHHPKFKDARNFGIVEPTQDYLWGTKL
ncbi:MAG: hypothetical protein K2P81_06585 [Bacteriovoracaceae bacterium]|nr:hypothetical protein [Bacteriovoracaceae bacterium]